MVTRMVDRSTHRAKLFSQVREIRVASRGRLSFHIPDRSTTGIHFSLSLPLPGSNKSIAGMGLSKANTKPASLPAGCQACWMLGGAIYLGYTVILPLLLPIGQIMLFLLILCCSVSFYLLTFLCMNSFSFSVPVFSVTFSILRPSCSLFTCPVIDLNVCCPFHHMPDNTKTIILYCVFMNSS